MSTNMKYVKLVMVTEENNNKFYEMTQTSDSVFQVKYGRIEGGTPATQSYSMSDWDKTYKSKVKKGYKDVTEYVAVKVAVTTANQQTNLADIADRLVKDLIHRLMAFANKSIQTNYTVTQKEVTQKQVDDAILVLDQIQNNLVIGQNCDKLLLQLFSIIPRRMAQVSTYLWGTITSANIASVQKAFQNESDTLDVMKGQVAILNASNKTLNDAQTNVKVAQTLLDSLGLEIRTVTDSEKKEILTQMGPQANLYKNAFRVENKITRKNFEAFVASKTNKYSELYWHGSRNENWISIMKGGLVLRPTNAVISGKMFGYGTYFASKFEKSLGYTSWSGSYWANGNSNTAFLALYDVHLGKQYITESSDSSLTETILKNKGGYDSCWGKAGRNLRNDEFIVYNEAATTIKYIVEIGK